MLNETIDTASQSYRVSQRLDIGGQGETYIALGQDGKKYACKVLFRTDDRPHEIQQRIDFLLGQRLDRISPLLAPAVDTATHRRPDDGNEYRCVFAPMRPGIPLETFIVEGSQRLSERLAVAVQITDTVNRLHQRGIAHGDIHSGNAIVQRIAGQFIVSIIDLDNFAATETPLPRCLGQLNYLAPEIRSAPGRRSRTDLIGLETDRYALAVLVHKLLLFRHPGLRFEDNPEAFAVEMSKGYWPDDPCWGDTTTPAIGLPSKALDCKLAQLMRCGLDQDPTRRPTAVAWRDALRLALTRVYCCDHCGLPNILDAIDQCCPSCNENYPAPALHLPDGTRMTLRHGPAVLGRQQLRSPYVSRAHATFKQIGPLVQVTPTGENGTWVASDLDPKTLLPPREQTLVEPEKLIYLADVCIRIELE